MGLIDMLGQRFGRLTIIEKAENSKTGHTRWLCQCDCGNKIIVLTTNLRRGCTQSCGCYRMECQSKRKKTHGMSKRKDSIYATWAAMKQRCNNSNAKAFPLYGGRGIKVCDRWNSFENFLADMGERPRGMSIHRKNNDGNYEKDNCIWATRKQQTNTRSSNRIIAFSEKTQTLKQWSDELNIKYSVLLTRLDKLGWTVERAFVTPRRNKMKNKLTKKGSF